MIKITKTIALAIKTDDIIFDINPEFHKNEAACFEVVKFNTVRNTVLVKGLNKAAYKHYIAHIKTKLIEFSLNDIDKIWFKLEIEVN